MKEKRKEVEEEKGEEGEGRRGTTKQRKKKANKAMYVVQNDLFDSSILFANF